MPHPHASDRFASVHDAGAGLAASGYLAVLTVRTLRALELPKSPSVAETLDGARRVLALGLDTFGDDEVRATLGVVLKHAVDHHRAITKLGLN